jgi:hypothetical protein
VVGSSGVVFSSGRCGTASCHSVGVEDGVSEGESVARAVGDRKLAVDRVIGSVEEELFDAYVVVEPLEVTEVGGDGGDGSGEVGGAVSGDVELVAGDGSGGA